MQAEPGGHPEFFTWSPIKDVLSQPAYVGILAAGMAFLTSTRELDLSVGSVFGLTLIVAAFRDRAERAEHLRDGVARPLSRPRRHALATPEPVRPMIATNALELRL